MLFRMDVMRPNPYDGPEYQQMVQNWFRIPATYRNYVPVDGDFGPPTPSDFDSEEEERYFNELGLDNYTDDEDFDEANERIREGVHTPEKFTNRF